jgi:hypothetical protein
VSAGSVGAELDALGEGEAGGVTEACDVGLDATCAVGLEPQPATTIARVAAEQTATTARTKEVDGRLARTISNLDPTPGPSLTSSLPPTPLAWGPQRTRRLMAS